jgi:phosphate transport system permease protein
MELKVRINKENIAKYIFFIAALTSVLAVALICIFLFANGVPAIKEIGFFNFIGGKKWAPNDVPASYGIFT